MPVIAVAIAALPTVALLLAVVTRFESAFLGESRPARPRRPRSHRAGRRPA